MVTGVETAGLVLAVFPLVVKGLSEYKVQIRRLQQTRQYSSELKKLIRSVKEQKVFLVDSLQRLLHAVVPDEVRRLSDDYNIELFSGDTGDRIAVYLGPEKLEIFKSSIEDFEKCLQDLVSELDSVQRAPKRNFNRSSMTLPALNDIIATHPKTANFFTKRVHLLIREEDIKRLTDDLSQLNKSMEKLLDNQEHFTRRQAHLRIVTDITNATALAGFFTLTRNAANILFHALQCARRASCDAQRQTLLVLESPICKKSLPSVENIREINFRLVAHACSTCSSLCPDWHEIDVATTLNHIAILPTHINNTLHPTFCTDLVQACTDKHTINLRLDDKGALVRVSNVVNNIPCTEPIQKHLSLPEMMTERRRLMPYEKVAIALRIAASFMQLSTSPWLNDKDVRLAVRFLKKLVSGVDPGQPLLTQTFDTLIQQSVNSSQERPKALFLDLGILLLEIHNERSLESWASQVHGKSTITRLEKPGLADAWYEDSYLLMSLRYGKVVRSCLAFAFEYEGGMPSWDDRSLNISICAKVVEPLQAEFVDAPVPP